MPNPITSSGPSFKGMEELHELHRAMDDNDHVHGNAVNLYASADRRSVSNANLAHPHQLSDAIGFSHGYGGVRKRIAAAVGERKADAIMADALGRDGAGRTRGWKTCFMPRKKGISKDQLGEILKKANAEIHRQFSKYDPKKAIKIEKRLRQMNAAQVIKDPEMSGYLRAHCAAEFQSENIDFIRDCHLFDALIGKAKKIESRLLDSNGKLRDDSGAEVQMGPNGTFIQKHGGAPAVGNRLVRLEQAIQTARQKAEAMRNRYIRQYSEAEINISYLDRGKLTNANLNGASLKVLEQFFGTEEEALEAANGASAKSDSKGGARGVIYGLLQSGFARFRNQFNSRRIDGKRVLSVGDFRDLRAKMDDDDHLRARGGNNPTVYIKTNHKVHKDNNDYTTRRGAHLINFLTQKVSPNNRLRKFNRTKEQMRAALADHIGSHASANRIMKDGFHDAYQAVHNKGLDYYLEFVDTQDEIDRRLTQMESQNVLHEINDADPADTYRRLVGNNHNDVSHLVQDYAKLHHPTVYNDMDRMGDCAIAFTQLRSIANNAGGNVAKDPQVAQQLALAKSEAKTALKYGKGLKTEERDAFRSIIQLSQKDLAKPDKLQQLRTAAKTANAAGARIAGELLEGFRNQSDVAQRISNNALPTAINQCSAGEIAGMTEADLHNEDSNVNKAFRLHCQATGKHESHPARVAAFSDKLMQFYYSGDPVDLRAVRQEAVALGKLPTLKFMLAKNPRKGPTSLKTPMQVLSRLLNKKTVKKEDALVLAQALSRQVKEDIDEFKLYATLNAGPNLAASGNNASRSPASTAAPSPRGSVAAGSNNPSNAVNNAPVSAAPVTVAPVSGGAAGFSTRDAIESLRNAGAGQQAIDDWITLGMITQPVIDQIAAWPSNGGNSNDDPQQLINELTDQLVDRMIQQTENNGIHEEQP